jgi:hydrogenase maturation factor
VHVGFALQCIDPVEAARLTELLSELAASQAGDTSVQEAGSGAKS